MIVHDDDRAPDRIDEAARLVEAVGTAAQDARRYRALAERLAEPTFDRAVTLGGVIRRALRPGAPSPADLDQALGELRTLLEECRRARAELWASPGYRAAVTCFEAGEIDRLARLVPDIFHQVVPDDGTTRLFWPVAIATRRPGNHFVPAEQLAAQLSALRDGIPAASPPPDLGADDHIRAVVLTDDEDFSDSPIVLRFDRTALPGPVSRLKDTPTILFHAAALACRFVVRFAPEVSDEWWSVRPDAYRAYRERVRTALAHIAPDIAIEGDC